MIATLDCSPHSLLVNAFDFVHICAHARISYRAMFFAHQSISAHLALSVRVFSSSLNVTKCPGVFFCINLHLGEHCHATVDALGTYACGTDQMRDSEEERLLSRFRRSTHYLTLRRQTVCTARLLFFRAADLQSDDDHRRSAYRIIYKEADENSFLEKSQVASYYR